MKQFVSVIVLVAVLATSSNITLEQYGPDAVDTLDYFSGPGYFEEVVV